MYKNVEFYMSNQQAENELDKGKITDGFIAEENEDLDDCEEQRMYGEGRDTASRILTEWKMDIGFCEGINDPAVNTNVL